MVKTSVLNDCLNAINNAEKAGKRQVLIRPSSKVIVKFLTVMQRHGMSKSLSSLTVPTSFPSLPFCSSTKRAVYALLFGLITRQ